VLNIHTSSVCSTRGSTNTN